MRSLTPEERYSKQLPKADTWEQSRPYNQRTVNERGIHHQVHQRRLSKIYIRVTEFLRTVTPAYTRPALPAQSLTVLRLADSKLQKAEIATIDEIPRHLAQFDATSHRQIFESLVGDDYECNLRVLARLKNTIDNQLRRAPI